MPEIYATYHDDFLQGFMENMLEGHFNSEYLNTNQNFFGKNKSGFIFPIISKTYFVREQIIFIGTFKPVPIMKNQIYLIVNMDGIIQDISAGAVQTLKIDLQNLRKNKTNIDTYVQTQE